MPSSEQTLKAAVRRYDRERDQLERQLQRNTGRRDKAIRKAHADGLTMREIAKVAGISHQRVYQIVKRG